MQRDFKTYELWHDWHKKIALSNFNIEKAKALASAMLIDDEKQRMSMVIKANKMTFQFDKSKLLNYGECLKFKKQVSFIPNTCQIENLHCFIHRKDFVN